MSKTTLIRILLFTVICTSTFLYGPSWIASIYRANTSEEQVRNMKAQYWAKAENDIWDAERQYALLWCRVRKIECDDGHIGPTLAERWAIVFNYWKLE